MSLVSLSQTRWWSHRNITSKVNDYYGLEESSAASGGLARLVEEMMDEEEKLDAQEEQEFKEYQERARQQKIQYESESEPELAARPAREKTRRVTRMGGDSMDTPEEEAEKKKASGVRWPAKRQKGEEKEPQPQQQQGKTGGSKGSGGSRGKDTGTSMTGRSKRAQKRDRESDSDAD